VLISSKSVQWKDFRLNRRIDETLKERFDVDGSQIAKYQLPQAKVQWEQRFKNYGRLSP
jgi:hypothetical protein